jgi:hypothetical protein
MVIAKCGAAATTASLRLTSNSCRHHRKQTTCWKTKAFLPPLDTSCWHAAENLYVVTFGITAMHVIGANAPRLRRDTARHLLLLRNADLAQKLLEQTEDHLDKLFVNV